MPSPVPTRAVITGAPGAGKSALLEALSAQGAATFPEVARAILKAPGGMTLRAERPADFAMAMLDAELAAWDLAGPGVSLYDRGFPDIAGFLKLEGLAVPDGLDHACRALRYNGPVFHARPWRAIYAADDQRIQSWEQAVASGEAVASAWCAYGYTLIDLPFVPVAQRAVFVMEHLSADLP